MCQPLSCEIVRYTGARSLPHTIPRGAQCIICFDFFADRSLPPSPARKMPSEDPSGLVRYVCVVCVCVYILVLCVRKTKNARFQKNALTQSSLPRCCILCSSSGPARKRPRPLEEAVGAGDGVALKFSETFAVDNHKLVLLQVSIVYQQCFLLELGCRKGFTRPRACRKFLCVADPSTRLGPRVSDVFGQLS